MDVGGVKRNGSMGIKEHDWGQKEMEIGEWRSSRAMEVREDQMAMVVGVEEWVVNSGRGRLG